MSLFYCTYFLRETFLHKYSRSMFCKSSSTPRFLNLGRFPVTPCKTSCGYSNRHVCTRCGAQTRHVCGKFDVAWVGFYECCDIFLLMRVMGRSVNNTVCMILWGCRGVLWALGVILCWFVCRSIFVCIFVQGCRGVLWGSVGVCAWLSKNVYLHEDLEVYGGHEAAFL